ncbi:restriction endonuclease [Pedobacter sp. SYSU D00535]|uniref:restriction endonuclease n=1 Tax=Pedobacter sp. SYSU D00535 TaxID=2810308 RepID=UPI001A96D4DE|nr:restriction endonuclease [Pedobacter sp. SYSU D00535]
MSIESHSKIVDVILDEHLRPVISGSRSRELFDLDTILIAYGHAIVYGEAGIGKTAFLKAFQNLNTPGFGKIDFRSGYEVEANESALLPYLLGRRIPRHDERPDLLIIDGFEEILSPKVKERIERLMREGRKYGLRVILSARQQINEKVFGQLSHSIWLRRLTDQEVNKMVAIYDHHTGEHPDMVSTIRGMMDEFNGNPRAILSALNIFFGLSANAERPFIYQNPIIIKEMETPTLIVEEAPKIITDIRVINTGILNKIKRQPHAIYQLTPRQFEIMVAELFDERGYKVQLTQQTRDGGKDLIIADHRELGNLMFYVECKRNAPDRPVGVSVISHLAGRILADRVTAGLVVTSSYFSADAIALQSKIEHQMSLIDFVKLSAMITEGPFK